MHIYCTYNVQRVVSVCYLLLFDLHLLQLFLSLHLFLADFVELLVFGLHLLLLPAHLEQRLHLQS